MSRLYYSILFLLLTVTSVAQIPQWAINLPKSGNATMSYVVGVGEGASYKEARNEAFNDVLRKLIVQYRLTVNSNDIMSAVYDGMPLSTISKDYNLPPMKEVCSFQAQQYGRSRVYVLYQTAANSMIGNPEFEPFTKCDNGRKKWNCYIAYNIAGTGYPWNLFSGIEFRYGKTLGVGGYLDLGMDFTHIKAVYVANKYDDERDCINNLTSVYFRYAVGVKFYAYKGLFVDFGYGSIAKPFATIEHHLGRYDDYPLHVTLSTADKDKICSQVTNSSGLLFHAGYNLVTKLDNGCGFFLGLSAGASYDIFSKETAPQFNLKIGVAWSVKKNN